MRRADQQISARECESVLRRARTGVLAVSGDGGYPYAVPVNPVYDGGKIFFHCAPEGHKIDALRRCGKVSFCVVAEDEVIPEKLSTAYLSVIVFGRARVVDDPAETRRIAERLGEKYARGFSAEYHRAIDKALAARKMVCVEITPEYTAGKCGRQLLLRREREKNNG